MSAVTVAETEFADEYLGGGYREYRAPSLPARIGPLATVTVLRPPSHRVAAAPLRLTRRGVLVLSLAVALLGAALLWVAALSAPATPATTGSGAASVTVRAGDTLWSIASRVAPDTDPRAEIGVLRSLNHLRDAGLTPGQQLRLR